MVMLRRRSDRVGIAGLKRKGYNCRRDRQKALLKRFADASEKMAVASLVFAALQELNTPRAFLIGVVCFMVSMFLTWRIGK